MGFSRDLQQQASAVSCSSSTPAVLQEYSQEYSQQRSSSTPAVLQQCPKSPPGVFPAVLQQYSSSAPEVPKEPSRSTPAVPPAVLPAVLPAVRPAALQEYFSSTPSSTPGARQEYSSSAPAVLKTVLQQPPVAQAPIFYRKMTLFCNSPPLPGAFFYSYLFITIQNIPPKEARFWSLSR